MYAPTDFFIVVKNILVLIDLIFPLVMARYHVGIIYWFRPGTLALHFVSVHL